MVDRKRTEFAAIAKIKRAFNSVEKLIDCMICFLPFNKNERKPQILKCGHTVCKKCIYKMNKSVEDIGIMIKCPGMCHIFTR